MNKELKKTISDRLERLPEDVREAVKSVNYSNFLQRVGQDYELSTNQRRSLFVEVLILLLGLEPVENYPQKLQDVLGVDGQTSMYIAEDTKEMIIEQVDAKLEEISKSPEKTEAKSAKQSVDPLSGNSKQNKSQKSGSFVQKRLSTEDDKQKKEGGQGDLPPMIGEDSDNAEQNNKKSQNNKEDKGGEPEEGENVDTDPYRESIE